MSSDGIGNIIGLQLELILNLLCFLYCTDMNSWNNEVTEKCCTTIRRRLLVHC